MKDRGTVFESLEDSLVTAMTHARIPGLAVAVVEGDQIVFERAFGTRKVEKNLPVTPETLFGIGSCTKSFTALAIMQLVSDGKISLTDPIDKYVPVTWKTNFEPVTVHHLLTHSSGFPDLLTAVIVIADLMGKSSEVPRIPLTSWGDFYKYINDASAEAVEPGKEFFYFNGGYALLGEIVSRVAGVPYTEYVTQNTLAPLEMKNSRYIVEEGLDINLSSGHARQPKEKGSDLQPTPQLSHELAYAGGGLLSSIRDLAKYMIALMNRGVCRSGTILPPASIDEMWKLQFPRDRRNRSGFGSFGKNGYGYGWFISEDFFGHRFVEHGGSTAVSSAHITLIPSKKIGVVGAANVGGFPFLPVLSCLSSLLGKDPEKEIPHFSLKKHYERLTGEYESYKGIVHVAIKIKEGILYLESNLFGSSSSRPLLPETDDPANLDFYCIQGFGSRNYCRFAITEDGAVDFFDGRTRYHKISSS